jgi:XTP/dITP diphosphohydrolase
MTFELLIGTQNNGKRREYQQLFTGLPLTLKLLDEVGLGAVDVEETGTTFAANAEIKAAAYAQAAGMFALADDSGLCVDALDGRPGVYSARYGGPGASDADKIVKLLGELEGVPDERRTAYFACAIVVYDPTTQTPHAAAGRVTGRIAHQPMTGDHGFGYDPVFIPDGYSVSLAQITPEEKNALSHRGRAAAAIRPTLERLIQGQG